MHKQGISVTKAKKAGSEFKKAVGSPEGLAELTVFRCEFCMNLLGKCGMDDQKYFDALVHKFAQALKTIVALVAEQQTFFVKHLDHVRHEGRNWGWGVGDTMGDLMTEYGFAKE